jgi:hypothetical protein
MQLSSAQENILIAWQKSNAVSVKFRLVVMAIFGLFFYSASLFIFLRGLSTLTTSASVTLENVLILVSLGLPPLIAGYGFLFLRHWIIYVLLVHISLAIVMVVPLLFFGLQNLIPSTLLNNLVVVAGLLAAISLNKKLYRTRYGLLIALLYGVLLLGTSSFQIYYRLTF